MEQLTADEARNQILEFVKTGEKTRAELVTFTQALESKSAMFEMGRLINSRAIRGRVTTTRDDNGNVKIAGTSYYIE